MFRAEQDREQTLSRNSYLPRNMKNRVLLSVLGIVAIGIAITLMKKADSTKEDEKNR